MLCFHLHRALIDRSRIVCHWIAKLSFTSFPLAELATITEHHEGDKYQVKTTMYLGLPQTSSDKDLHFSAEGCGAATQDVQQCLARDLPLPVRVDKPAQCLCMTKNSQDPDPT